MANRSVFFVRATTADSTYHASLAARAHTRRTSESNDFWVQNPSRKPVPKGGDSSSIWPEFHGVVPALRRDLPILFLHKVTGSSFSLLDIFLDDQPSWNTYLITPLVVTLLIGRLAELLSGAGKLAIGNLVNQRHFLIIVGGDGSRKTKN